jgi:hypothetical protein
VAVRGRCGYITASGGSRSVAGAFPAKTP